MSTIQSLNIDVDGLRVGSGQLTTEGGNVLIGNSLVVGGTIVPRMIAVSDGTSITANSDIADIVFQNNTQVAGILTINAPLGTPLNGQKLIYRIQSTNAQTFSWNTAAFGGSSDIALPTTTTGSGKFDYVGFLYNTAASKWQILAKNFGF
jgi:hypothetical protein